MSALPPAEFLKNHESYSASKKIEALVSLLRGPDGCPWDQKQTAESILDCLIDEAHELKEALNRGTPAEIVGELGDLAFTFTFLQQTLQPRADLEAASTAVVEKMIARHPHVFEADQSGLDEGQIKRNWERLKRGEGETDRRYDRDLAASLPAWKKASKVLSRARNAGFRYRTPEAAWEKVGEEWHELQHALEGEGRERQEAEFGDLLLALLTASKEAEIDGERALLASTRRLADRLERLEGLAGRSLSEIPHEELGDLYARARAELSESAKRPAVYFNYCGVSPWPGEVSRAVSRAARTLGRTGLAGALAMRNERETLRERLAHFIGAPAAQVVLVPNISSAGLAVAHCLDWAAGDRVLLGRHEFPANNLPWRLAAETFSLEVLQFDEDLLRRDSERGWSELERLLEQRRPRLLALSAVSYWSGFRLPLERVVALCQKSGTMLYIDAIQALGTVPVRMLEGVDFLSGGSHKAMRAPEGAGFLAVSGRGQEHWVPRLAGWLGLPDPVDFLLAGDPEANPNATAPRPRDPGTAEIGSQNALGYAGLAGSLDYLERFGVDAIYQHVQELHDALEPAMVALGFCSERSPRRGERSALLCFLPPQGVTLPKLQAELSALGVETSIPRGRLRFGAHMANSEADVQRAVEVMPEALRRAAATPQ